MGLFERKPSPTPAPEPQPEPEPTPAAAPKAQVIAFTNQKGGVAKTTTTLNLAAAFSERGFRVLCIDLDPQTNLTTVLLGEDA